MAYYIVFDNSTFYQQINSHECPSGTWIYKLGSEVTKPFHQPKPDRQVPVTPNIWEFSQKLSQIPLYLLAISFMLGGNRTYLSPRQIPTATYIPLFPS